MEDIKGWSEQVENLQEEGKIEEAEALLEKVIKVLKGQDDADVSLQLVAALTDAAKLCYKKGLSLKADDMQLQASHIQRRAESIELQHSSEEQSLRTDTSDQSKSAKGSRSQFAPSQCASNQTTGRSGDGGGFNGDDDRTSRRNAGDEANEEEGTEADWETEWEANLHKIKPVAEKTKTVPGLKNNVEAKGSAVKQRGRGAFRFGSSAMYSDHLAADGESAGTLSRESDGRDQRGGSDEEDADKQRRARLDFLDDGPHGTGHVVEMYGFDPSLTTADLERLVQPYKKDGVAIRWVDDTHALAVFASPTIAHRAVGEMRDPSLKVRMFSHDSESAAHVGSRELEPPVPRPTTSARTARRMIASALNDSVAGNAIRERGKKEVGEEKRAEAERRQRLATRRKLRDDAWGED